MKIMRRESAAGVEAIQRRTYDRTLRGS